jgi:UDP-2,3-diacylglucosamine hydrolase
LSSAFFISDVHLKKMASPNGEALLSLLRKAQSEASLFVILGDLFDIWVGEGHAFQEEYAPLVAEFVKLRKNCRILYFEGNHDLHLKKFWADKMGFEIKTGADKINFNGVRIWAEHGDEINREDYGYLFLRWFLRTPPLKFAIESLPSKIVFAIGNRASAASRQYTDSIENRSRGILREYALRVHEREGFQFMLTGHTHLPDDFQFATSKGDGRLINLGSWFDGPHYLKIDSNGNLEQLNIES